MHNSDNAQRGRSWPLLPHIVNSRHTGAAGRSWPKNCDLGFRGHLRPRWGAPSGPRLFAVICDLVPGRHLDLGGAGHLRPSGARKNRSPRRRGAVLVMRNHTLAWGSTVGELAASGV